MEGLKPDDEPDEPSAPAHTLSPSELADLLVDSLDIGVLVADVDGKVLRSNHIANHLMAAFGTPGSSVPAALWSGIRPIVEAALAIPGRFTPASPITATDKRRFFVRCRSVRHSALVITIAPAALREIDVQRVLAEQFGLSAQEIRIAFFAAQGYRNREIAETLGVVEGTVKNYLTSVFAALSVRSRTELASELSQLIEEQTDIHRRGGGGDT